MLTAKGMPDLKVPIVHESVGKEMRVNVWKADVLAIDQGDEAAEWINTFLAEQLGDRKLRFVHFKESFTRPTHERYAPGHQTGQTFSPFSCRGGDVLTLFHPRPTVPHRVCGCFPHFADSRFIAR